MNTVGAGYEHCGCNVRTWWVQCVNMVGPAREHGACNV